MASNYNVGWIQNTDFGQQEYFFHDTILLKEDEHEKIKEAREILFNNKAAKPIWKAKKPSQSSVSSFESGYIITGVLESLDAQNRRLPFMFFVIGDVNEMKTYVEKRLESIDKTIDPKALNTLVSKTTKKSNKLGCSIPILGILLILTILIF